MKAFNVTPAMTLAAEAMIANDMDYWPYGLIDYSVSEDADYCLYSFDDGVWLVDTNNTCSMNDAIKLVLVLSVPAKSNDDCTACNGLGEVETQGSYADFEPPVRKCDACNGSGSAEIQEWKESVWRDTAARHTAMNRA